MGGKVEFTYADGTKRFAAGSIEDLHDVMDLKAKLQGKTKKKIVAWNWRGRLLGPRGAAGEGE